MYKWNLFSAAVFSPPPPLRLLLFFCSSPGHTFSSFVCCVWFLVCCLYCLFGCLVVVVGVPAAICNLIFPCASVVMSAPMYM